MKTNSKFKIQNSKLFWLALILNSTFLIFNCFSQQTPTYTQFVLNQYASNPAYAGTNIGSEAVAGQRYQWLGFANAPITTFGSFTFAWKKNFNYKSKQA